jgi:poly(beta-D-mannuronate) lyase
MIDYDRRRYVDLCVKPRDTHSPGKTEERHVRGDSRSRTALWRSVVAGATWALTLGQSAAAREYRVTRGAEIATLENEVHPGDVVIMADGTWTDQKIAFRGKGTYEEPVTLRPETPGKVILTGSSSLDIDGEHLVVRDLWLRDGTASGDTVRISGSRCRLTETAIVACQSKFNVHVFGTENRVDHCYLAGKTSDSPTMQVEAEGRPNRHRIDHNHFGPRPPLGRNGGETIRVGYSGQSMSESRTLVERNLFDRCDGEIEIISSKSCGNVYRRNTFLACAGMLTLRHGNRCLVAGNFFLGKKKRGSGGIRIIGEDHTIVNNYIEGVRQGAFWVTSGIPDSPLNGYFQARNVRVAFNTVVDSLGPCIELDAGIGSSGRSLRPERITIANNVFSVPEDGLLLKGKEGDGFRWAGNMASSLPTGFEHVGIVQADLRLERADDGLWRPVAGSRVLGAADGSAAAVRFDIDGQVREGRLDAGADQLSKGRIMNRPLTPVDVGPSWMDR